MHSLAAGGLLMVGALTLLCLAGVLWCVWKAWIAETAVEKRIRGLAATRKRYDGRSGWGRW